MPRINRPQSNIARNVALREGKNRKDQVPAMPIIPYSAATILWLDTFQPLYKAAFDAVSDARQDQTNLTRQVVKAKKIAIYNEQDFVLNLNRGIRREVLLPTDRSYYDIAIDNDKALKVSSEAQVIDINDVLTNGEAERIADGGTPILFPSIGQVNTAVANFKTLNDAQAPAKVVFDTTQEALAAMNDEADRLILKMWNETETAFDTGDKPSMRRKCREWGVVYKHTPEEGLNPDDFSIVGKVTDSVTGEEIDEVVVHVLPPDVFVLTDDNGDYLIGVLPPASYNIEVHKAGYVDKVISGVVVVAGEITTLNIQLVSEENAGTITGTVTQGGVPVQATITVLSTATGTTTDPSGHYTLSDVPAGSQTIRAALVADPALFITHTVTVVAGDSITENFVFP